MIMAQFFASVFLGLVLIPGQIIYFPKVKMNIIQYCLFDSFHSIEHFQIPLCVRLHN